MEIRMLEGNRTLTLGAVGGIGDLSISPPFVALVPSYSAPERRAVEAIAKELIRIGCVEFCCVGPEAELVHDALDQIIEDVGTLEVATTGIIHAGPSFAAS